MTFAYSVRKQLEYKSLSKTPTCLLSLPSSAIPPFPEPSGISSPDSVPFFNSLSLAALAKSMNTLFRLKLQYIHRMACLVHENINFMKSCYRNFIVMQQLFQNHLPGLTILFVAVASANIQSLQIC